MISGLRIERANSEDKEIVAALLIHQFREHAIETSQERLAWAVDQVLHDEDHGFFLLAKVSDCTLGVANVAFSWTLEHGGKSAWLDELYVMPEYRGRGIGTALLKEAIAEARHSGCAAVDLEVDENHRKAQNLYQREGFRRLFRSRWVKMI
jgi:ribosomal protein S18 acetylase RimI-like enzyme